MAQFTSNIGLHQWEPGDNFLRTDFNQDFAKIDGAFGQCGTVQGWLEDAAARVGYEALQCRLAADAEGKNLPQGRGLIFDSFRTGGRITLSGGCGMKDTGGILLDAQSSLTDFDNGFGSNYDCDALDPAEDYHHREVHFSAGGNGTVNTLKIYLRGSTTTKAYLSILQNGSVLWSSGATTMTLATKLYTFYPNLAVKKGVRYTVKVSAGGVGNLQLMASQGGYGFGFYLGCSSAGGKSGTVTTNSQTMPPFRGARAWVRHSGGTVGCSISRAGGAHVSLERGETRSITDIRGKACTETEFRLPPGETPAGGSVRFQISIQNQTDAELRDFGAVLL